MRWPWHLPHRHVEISAPDLRYSEDARRVALLESETRLAKARIARLARRYERRMGSGDPRLR